ncbi:FKBP-type peptidyl-prolyl cis-trans isomerase [Actinoplanes sp. NPDC049802]|uniref:FKBP-type peptidyl-prolyl cis-trans isomerase n=1 Tax=Actinoplanes sp. NPDC049802 TaxID=3154742 RepID=UPI0033E3ABAF
MNDKKRRGQAIAGVLSGALVFVVLVVVFSVVRDGGDAPEPSQAASAQAAAPAPPASVAPASGPAALTQEPDVKPGTGTVTELTVKELVPGTGAAVKAGQTITVNYKLISYSTGQQIDSSWTNGVSQPYVTQIGVGQVIQGWDKGIPGRKVGSRIQLDVPAALAYGPERGDLRFVVDILSAK